MTGPGWLEGAVPSVPESVRPWLELPSTDGAGEPGGPDGFGGSGAESGPSRELGDPRSRGGWPGADRLERAAMGALDRALAPEGRERRGAFDLLAADAFLTWAAEAALDDEDPELRLGPLARQVAGAPDAGAARGRGAHA